MVFIRGDNILSCGERGDFFAFSCFQARFFVIGISLRRHGTLFDLFGDL